MPKGLVYILTILLTGLLIPPALIATMRSTVKKKPRIHYIQDMDNQFRYKAQQVNEFFDDQRAMRQPVRGTIARGELQDDPHYDKGLVDGAWAETFPAPVGVTVDLIERGRDRFNIYCLPCHGEAGFGDGIIHERAFRLVTAGVNGTQWVEPKSLHEAAIREQPLGQTFSTITNGVRTMAGYGSQIPVDDRWAIVAYVKALQRSQHAKESDLPADVDLNSLPFEALPEDQVPEPAATESDDAASDETTAETGGGGGG